MDLKEYIGKEIRQRRKELALEQGDLMDYAGIGSTTLSTLEQGKANITLSTLEKITNILGLEVKIVVKR